MLNEVKRTPPRDGEVQQRELARSCETPRTSAHCFGVSYGWAATAPVLPGHMDVVNVENAGAFFHLPSCINAVVIRDYATKS
jgi:hypothetical protein